MRVPSYRLHRSSGQAVVTINGRDLYLGVHGSQESRQKYARLIAEWSASGQLVQPARDATVEEVLAAYWIHAERYYQKDGQPTSQLARVRQALKPARELYADTPARDFGPRALKAVRQRYIDRGWCRRLVNQSTGCLVRAFKWACAEELVSGNVYEALRSVEGLRRGRTNAPDHKEIRTVSAEIVEATLPHLPPIVADLVRVQLLTGARPGEAVLMRGDALDRSGEVWLWRPATHKTAHHGRDKTMFVGPRCQVILTPYLERHGGGYLFSPRESIALFRAQQRATRKTPVQPSQVDRKKDRPRKSPGEHYTREAYDRAVFRACEKAGVPHWSPGKLRHNAATALVKEHGWEVTRVVLGHRHLDTTRIYAEDDLTKAIEIMKGYG